MAAADAGGLAVYRNTVAKGLADALVANFPTVERLVGETWLRAAVREFAAVHPPARPALLDYGQGFPAWLAAFPPAAAMPYLATAAQADRFWTEAHLAADAAPLGPGALDGLDAVALAATRAVPHPSARLLWSNDNAPSLWLANRPPAATPEGFELSGEAQGLLIARPGGVVESRLLDAPAFAFLSGCCEGVSLAAAAARALEAAADANLAAIVALALENGIFVALQPAGEGRP